MEEPSSYWAHSGRLRRRRFLQVAGGGTAGLTGLALLACSSSNNNGAGKLATGANNAAAAPTSSGQATAAAANRAAAAGSPAAANVANAKEGGTFRWDTTYPINAFVDPHILGGGGLFWQFVGNTAVRWNATATKVLPELF